MNILTVKWTSAAAMAALISAGAAAGAARAGAFDDHHGGYAISTGFSVGGARHAVISLPPDAQAGDLLGVRPLRLNDDEYLVLQKCAAPDCSRAEIVRAWNSSGAMGPFPVPSDKVAIESQSTYLLWLQRLPTKGSGTFALYEQFGKPLSFVPAGSARLMAGADLQAAAQHGPSRIVKTSRQGSTYVATFEGGSVVRMQLLRAEVGATGP